MAVIKVDMDYIESVTQRTNIITVAKRYTDLDETGRGDCPLCRARTTFRVRVIAGSGYYHCYLCDAAGGVFDLVKAMEGVSFADAVRRLGVE